MSYLGSKAQAGVWQRIICQMPPHSVYVEPFFGSGQIFWRKLPAAENVIIDADRTVIAKFGANGRHVSPETARRSATSEQARSDRRSLKAICGDALQILPTLALPADAVIYCDPPYVHSTRTSRHGYRFEMTDDQHAQLLALLQSMPCRVLLSGYPCALYRQALQNWRCISYRTRTRGKTVTECLWCNFAEPEELHDWRFIGGNYRERLTLKRFAARFVARLDRMPPLKRNFVLSLIEKPYSGQ